MITDADLIAYDQTIAKIIRIGDYHKIRINIACIDKQLESLEDPSEERPRNAREDSIRFHNKVKKPALEAQRKRLVKRMELLEESIKKDMESEK